MNMRVSLKQLNELKRSKRIAHFRLSDGTIITGIVQDVNVNDVRILSNGVEQIVAHSAIEQIKPAPRHSGYYYARAKRAELEKDFATAEEYFRKAIQNNDCAEKAVRSLASLLDQQERTEEAIQELESFLRISKVSKPFSFFNQLISLYQRPGDYVRAIELIDENLHKMPANQRPSALQQKAYCQMQLNQLEEAEKTLQHLFSLIAGPFLRFYIERCTYEGIPDARRASRNFTP